MDPLNQKNISENLPGNPMANQVQKINDLADVFYKKPIHLFIFKKTQKIAEAVYIVSDLVKDIEPLKWSFRKNAAEILALTPSFNDVFKDVDGMISSLIGLRGIIDFAKKTKVVSHMNSDILIREIDALLQILINEIRGEEKVLFSEEYFFVEKPQGESLHKSFQGESFALEGLSLKDPNNYKGQDKRQTNVFYNKPNSSIVSISSPLNNKQKFSPTSVQESRGDNKGQRREEILKILSKESTNGISWTIKDISKNIKDCSEKTIQRELTDMLLKGQIKKTGERRWSRYSIV